jgi:ABC-type antimicrobial peptide transport system permease subunit
MTAALLMIGLWPIELAAIVWAIRRSGFLPFPHGLMLYLFTGQMMLALHAYGFLYYGFVRIYTTYAYIHFFPQMFLLQAIMLFALCPIVPKARVSVGDAIRDLEVSETIFWALILLLYACWFIIFLSIDWSVVWTNSVYLTMTDPEKALVWNNAFTRLAFTLSGPLGILAAAATAFTFCSGRARLGVVLLPITAWSFIFALAAHSRASSAYLILAGLVAAMFPRARVAAGILVVIGFATTLSVLWGRGSGHHGISSLSAYLSNIVDYYEVSGLDAISNVYEGVFTTAEYFAHSFRFDPVYKRLSLSPLFSFIDGYDQVRELYSIRLSYYVPNPAISEVLSFGVGYAVIYFGVLAFAGYQSARLVVRRPGLVSLGLNALVLLSSYLQFAYDTRGNFRSFFYIAILCWFLNRQWEGQQRRALAANGHAGERDAGGTLHV